MVKNSTESLVAEFNKKLEELKRLSHDIRAIDRSAIQFTGLMDGKNIEIEKKDFCVPENVSVFADRKSIIRNIAVQDGRAIKAIAEIGVLHGVYSAFLDEIFNLSEFHLFDRDLSKISAPIEGGHVKRHEGNSRITINELEDESLDLAYIDGDHTRKGVMADVEALLPKMKKTSWLVFNDYSCFNVACLEPYGVIHAVHNVLNSTDYKLHSMCLRSNSLNDVCLRRI